MSNTPKEYWPIRILRWFCPLQLLEEIEGDLIQKFEKDFKTFGEGKAMRRLLWNVIRFFRPGILFRNRLFINANPVIMLHHYFNTYLRNVSKNRISAAVNLGGLVVGLASALAMSLFIESEFSFDRFKNSANIYRVVFGPDDNSGSVFTPHVLGTFLESNYPGVKTIRFNNAGNARVNFKRADKQFMETAFYFTDAEALQVFPFRLIEGNPETCLEKPFTIVITQRAATKFFGSENPVGKSLSMSWINKDYDLQVTGLIDESSFRSHLSFDYLISMATAERLFQPQSFFTDWTANFNVTYLLIEEQTTAVEIDRSLTDHLRSNSTLETPDATSLRLQPLHKIHLYSHLSREISTNSDVKYLYLAACIGVLVLVVSLINYANLLSAQYTLRLKEIGVRKSLGAGRHTIFRQFLGESLTNVVLALLLAIAIMVVLLPFISSQLGTTWSYSQIIQIPGVWISIIALLTTGFISGLYPSLIVSKKDAGEILYGRTRFTYKGVWVKNGLVAIQLMIALFILTGALTVQKQLQFMQSQDLGFDKDLILTMPHGRAIRERSEFVKREMAQTGLVISSTLSSQLPSRSLGYKVPALVEGGNPNGTQEPWPVSVVSVDYDFFKTFGLQLLEGRTAVIQMF